MRDRLAKKLAALHKKLARYEAELRKLETYTFTVLGEQLPLRATTPCKFADTPAERASVLAPLYAHAKELAKAHKQKFVLMHSCDVPMCCEVTHFHFGTYKDNSRDMMLKMRGPSRGRRLVGMTEYTLEVRRVLAKEQLKKLRRIIAIFRRIRRLDANELAKLKQYFNHITI